ncbi:unnamed protein product [Mytilus edulis]|uniref:Uncharacterized protein n=1 Tax=Mytilus edulis TaxID=6550 RepID=A0A8S3PU84_MYTED|nr:unnamed protein product [Mytilus edulis]
MSRYKNKPSFAPQFARNYSSSDTDNDQSYCPTPKRISTMSSTNTSPSPSHAAKTEKSTDDLFQILITIKDNQESMRKSLEQRMTNLEKNFTREIKENMDKLKSEMTLEFAQVDNKIKELETKMKDVEFKLTQNVNIENSGNSVHPKLVFKNVQPIDNESEESLKVYANGLLRALELDFDVLKVERITAHLNRTAASPNQRPKPLIVSFADETQRTNVLRNKRKLKNNENFSNIYRARSL